MVTFNIIAIIMIFSGMVMTFPFVKRDEIGVIGWGLDSLGWLIMVVISFINGNILLAVFDFILLIGGLYFLIIIVKKMRK